MRVVAVWLSLAGCLACGSTTRNPLQEARGGSPVGGSSGEASAGSRATGGAPLEDGLRAPPSPMRRLNAFEYGATVEDVLGVKGAEPVPIGGELGGFDNMAAVLPVAPHVLEGLLAAAEGASRESFADATLRAALPPCPAGRGCVAGFVKDLSLRLFRRPASADELAPYTGVYNAAVERGVPHDAALQQVLVSLLMSSQLLFRMEPARSDAVGEEPLDSYALATRLSYLLWSSAPDAPLLAAAEANELQTDAGISAAFARLLADPRSRRFVTSFAGQWLGFRRLEAHPVNAQRFAAWDSDLANELANEGYAYFEVFLRSGQPWQEFLSTAIPGPGPLRTTRYAPDSEPRLGFLSLPAWLTVTSFDSRTSPSIRGTFLRERLLCTALPPPPADAPILEDLSGLPAGTRAAVESISSDPRCATCHVLIDPLGLALEHYDLVGQYRTHDANDGVAVDPVVQVASGEHYPNGLSLTGLNDVGEYIAEDPAFMTCLMRKLYTYGLGRLPEEAVDDENIALLAERWQGDASSLTAALSTLVQSKPFRFRAIGGVR